MKGWQLDGAEWGRLGWGLKDRMEYREKGEHVKCEKARWSWIDWHGRVGGVKFGRSCNDGQERRGPINFFLKSPQGPGYLPHV